MKQEKRSYPLLLSTQTSQLHFMLQVEDHWRQHPSSCMSSPLPALSFPLTSKASIVFPLYFLFFFLWLTTLKVAAFFLNSTRSCRIWLEVARFDQELVDLIKSLQDP